MSTNRLMTFELLDRMEQVLSEAKAIPLTKKFMLDKEEFSSLMRRLEESIPVDVQNAKTIIDQEENIISESNRIAEETTRNANAEAQSTVENAKQEANAMVADAQARAAETLRTSTDQANAMVADAQTRANALVADAQARSAQMVADSEIVARAQAEAQEMLESAHRDCEAYTARVHDSINQLMEQLDMSMSQQADAVRALRQQYAGQQ